MPDIWIPVTQQNLEIEAGSPLDFSTFLSNPPIDEERRLIVNSDGHIALQSNPAVPYRLLCGAIATIPDHVTADRMAVQLRRHGYNCARFHFLDIALMEGQLQDFEYRQDILDRFRYYMAALKQNGIYWVIDGLTSNAGALGGVTDRWGTEGRLKLKTHVENAAFGHWLRFQVDIFGTVNPYTGLVPFEDPAMAMVVPFNENGLVFNSWVYANGDLQTLAELKRPFNAWLEEQYGATAALQAAWGGELLGTEQIENATVALPSNRYAASWYSPTTKKRLSVASAPCRCRSRLGMSGSRCRSTRPGACPRSDWMAWCSLRRLRVTERMDSMSSFGTMLLFCRTHRDQRLIF